MTNQRSTGTSQVDPGSRQLAVLGGILAASLLLSIILKLAGVSWPLFFVLMFCIWAFLLYVGADLLTLILVALVILCAIAGASIAGGDDAIWGAIIGGLIPVAVVVLVTAAVVLGPPALAAYGVHEAMGGGCLATGLAFLTFAVVLLIVYIVAAFVIGFLYAAVAGELAITAAAFITGMIDIAYLASSLSHGNPSGAIDALLDMLQADVYMQIGHIIVIIGAIIYGILCVSLFLREGMQKRPLSLPQIFASLRGETDAEPPAAAAPPPDTRPSATDQTTPPPLPSSAQTLAEELRALDDAHRQGLISDDDYHQQRERILKQL